mgnify:CR=1 FL=1
MTMAKDANVFARVDASLKEQAEGILSQLGMPMSSAINIFLNQIVLRRGLPFEVTLPVKIPVAAGSLTSDEFYTEVKRGYDDCAAGRVKPAEQVFQEIEAEFGL